MDGRWKWIPVALCAAALGGCSWLQPKPQYPFTPATMPPSAPTAPTPPPQTASNRSITIAEPADDPNSQKEGPLSPQTLVLFAGGWVESATKDPNRSPAERERLLSQARQAYHEAAQRDPTNPDSLLGLAQMYQTTGEMEKLADVESKLRRQFNNNAKVWAWIAVRQGQAREWDAAAESYTKAANLDPDNRLYRIHLGFTLARAGRYEEGYKWLAKAMRESEARLNLAQMMVHTGQFDQARQQLGFALQIDPGYKPAQDMLASISSASLPTTPAAPDVRLAGYQEPVRTAPPKIGTGIPAEPVSVGNPGGPMPVHPAYQPTTGWDSSRPIR